MVEEGQCGDLAPGADGQAKWKVELKTPVGGGVTGLPPQSQIMDLREAFLVPACTRKPFCWFSFLRACWYGHCCAWPLLCTWGCGHRTWGWGHLCFPCLSVSMQEV